MRWEDGGGAPARKRAQRGGQPAGGWQKKYGSARRRRKNTERSYLSELAQKMAPAGAHRARRGAPEAHGRGLGKDTGRSHQGS